MDEFIAVIKLFGLNFNPRNWLYCQGGILAISSNTALFSLLGTTYGGNGQTTFALPDLRGRTAIGMGQGSGLSSRQLGEVAGTEVVTLTSNQMPLHTHLIGATTAAGSTAVPTNAILAAGPKTGSGPNATSLNTYANGTPNTTLGTNSVGVAGGSQPFSIMQPSLVLNYCICVYGIFPSRN
jgi:microcystin-dependent protein